MCQKYSFLAKVRRKIKNYELCQGGIMQFYLDKDWLIDVFRYGRYVDFNQFSKQDLVNMLNYLRLCLAEEILNGKV